MNKKSQAAMEFLMNYGWAILVVLVAIGALAYFGVLNPSRFLPKNVTEAEITNEMCEEYCIKVEGMDFESCSMQGPRVSITCTKGDERKRVRLTKVEMLNMQ